MQLSLLLAASVIIACIMCNRISSRFGIPMLFVFILLGMFFGSDGVIRIRFDNFGFAEQICSIALIFIMFYGGFGTKWSAADRTVLLWCPENGMDGEFPDRGTCQFYGCGIRLLCSPFKAAQSEISYGIPA